MQEKLTKDQAAVAVSRYLNGESGRIIAADFGVHENTIYRLVRLAGETVRSLCVLTPTLIESIRVEYLHGCSSLFLARKYAVSKFTVLSALQQSGTPIRSRSECKRVYELDETAFDHPGPEATYWAGFLLADGSVYVKRRGSPLLQLSIAEEDRQHVEAFRLFLKSTHPINTIPATRKWIRGRSCQCQAKAELQIPSRRLVVALARYGVVSQKSQSATPVGVAFNRDFWRGVVDGDGCLGFFSRLPRPLPYIHLCGSEQTVLQFRQAVQRLTPSCKASVYKTGRLFEFKCTGAAAVATVRWLYADSFISLARKASKAFAILGKF